MMLAPLKKLEARGNRETPRSAALLRAGCSAIRAFHEAVLGQGALPLDTLERQVDGFISRING
jgi:uncharacterized protein (DUF885 family)